MDNQSLTNKIMMIMRISFLKYSLLVFAIGLLFTSCSQEARDQLKATPDAYGPRNQLIVVMDQDLWLSDVGDTVRYYYASAYPILPQPEPIFDLTHFTPEEMLEDPLRRELRNFLYVGDLSDTDSGTTKMLERDLGSEKNSSC